PGCPRGHPQRGADVLLARLSPGAGRPPARRSPGRAGAERPLTDSGEPGGRTRRRAAFGILVAAGLLIALTFVSFSVGRFPVGPTSLVRLLAAKATGAPSDLPPAGGTGGFRMRGLRVLPALAIGAALAAAGAAYQGLFRNPLVSPDILGVSAGAGLGAGVGIFLFLPVIGIRV